MSKYGIEEREPWELVICEELLRKLKWHFSRDLREVSMQYRGRVLQTENQQVQEPWGRCLAYSLW